MSALPTDQGSLFAMMLDMKRTFDEVVESHADPARAQQILTNPFYQALSSSFAGTQEYMAMEKLGQLRVRAEAEGTWDLIIVDTPPSRSALDFLDAPARLGSFLDGRFIRILTAPARGAGKGLGRLAAMGFGIFTSVLNKILGAQVLADLGTFVAAIDTTFGGFRERADATYALLKDPGTSFVVVAAPERDALREAAYFVERLRTDQMPLAGLVLNRVQDVIDPDFTAEQAAAGAQLLTELAGDDDGRAGEDARLTAALLQLHAQRMNLSATAAPPGRSVHGRASRGSGQRRAGAGRGRARPRRAADHRRTAGRRPLTADSTPRRHMPAPCSDAGVWTRVRTLG